MVVPAEFEFTLFLKNNSLQWVHRGRWSTASHSISISCIMLLAYLHCLLLHFIHDVSSSHIIMLMPSISINLSSYLNQSLENYTYYLMVQTKVLFRCRTTVQPPLTVCTLLVSPHHAFIKDARAWLIVAYTCQITNIPNRTVY